MYLRSNSSAISVQPFQNERGVIAVATETIYESVIAGDVLRRGGEAQGRGGGLEASSGRDRALRERETGGKCAQRAGSAEGFAEAGLGSANRNLLEASAEDVAQRV